MYHPRLKGNHYEMGIHYGALLYEKGLHLTDIINLSDEEKQFGAEALKIAEKLLPKICDEMRGMADGQKMDYVLFSSWLLSMFGFGDIHGCTCFCFNCNSKTYLTRNSDMFPDLKETSESVLYRPEDGYTFLGNTTSFIQIEDGMNEHGLAAAINFLMTKKYKIGLNTGMIVRAILETCKTVDEAIDFIKNVPIATTQNIMLADATGKLAVVECSPDKVAIRHSDNYLISTNEFILPEMQTEHNNPEENWYRSHDRYETVEKAFAEYKIRNLDFIKEVQSGKRGFTCQYPKDINFDTLWSSIYETTSLEILRAEGNPSRTSFKEDTRLTWGIKASRSKS